MERTATTPDGTISYQVDGPDGGPALLLINSIGTTRELWSREVPAFSRTHRVIRYDARGHGASSVPAGDYTIEQLGRDALAVLDAAGVGQAHVCGISLGGLTAIWLGINAPARVSGLVLANTAARVGTVQGWTDRIALVREKGMSAVADLAMPIWFTPAFRERDPETVHVFRAMLQSCPVEGYLGCCAALRDADLRPGVAGITAPTLAVAGDTDVSTPVASLEYLRDTIPAARMVTLEAAHLSNIEQSEAFTDAVLQFLTATQAS